MNNMISVKSHIYIEIEITVSDEDTCNNDLAYKN